jgi:hypothetical protein
LNGSSLNMQTNGIGVSRLSGCARVSLHIGPSDSLITCNTPARENFVSTLDGGNFFTLFIASDTNLIEFLSAFTVRVLRSLKESQMRSIRYHFCNRTEQRFASMESRWEIM